MKLLGSSRSPYVQKVRIVIGEKGLDCAHEETSPADPMIAALNPLAKIPTLLRDDGTGLYDSVVIVEYLDGLTPSPRLIPEEFAARIEVRRWEALGDGVLDAIVAISHQKRLPAAQQREPEYLARHEKKIAAGLAAMAAGLGDRDFLHGDGLTLADIACAAALIYLEKNELDAGWRARHPALARHFATMSARDSVRALG